MLINHNTTRNTELSTYINDHQSYDTILNYVNVTTLKLLTDGLINFHMIVTIYNQKPSVTKRKQMFIT